MVSRFAAGWELPRRSVVTPAMAVLWVTALSGCGSIRDAILQDKLYLKNKAEAREVWSQQADAFRHLPHRDEFQRGFRDGYVAVALGADGCPPTLPPKRYWKPQYRDDLGKLRVTAWYNGYAEGASAAIAHRAPERNRVHTSLDIYGTQPAPVGSPASHLEPTPASPGEQVPSALPPTPLSTPATPPTESTPPIPEAEGPTTFLPVTPAAPVATTTTRTEDYEPPIVISPSVEQPGFGLSVPQ